MKEIFASFWQSFKLGYPRLPWMAQNQGSMDGTGAHKNLQGQKQMDG